MTNSPCALCQSPVTHFKIVSEGEKAFCCHGCHAVYNILESASALEGFENHPVFQQAVKFGLISNPELLEQIKKNECPKEKRKWRLEIQNMWCLSCGELIKLILLRHKGIASCVVDYATDLASIEYYPQWISQDEISKLISSLGYLPVELSASIKPLSKALYNRFLVAAFCSLNIMMFAYPLYAIYLNFDMAGVGDLFAWLSFAFSLPVIFYSAYPIFLRCFHGLKVGLLGMETLVAIGTLAAFGLSLYEMLQGSSEIYFDSMTVIIAFVLLGKIIESKAKFSSKEMLFELHRSLPQKARKVFKNGEERHVLLKEIRIGDLLSIHSGEKIALDGIVESGQAACNESLITGESLPVMKQAGMAVIAGALVQSGSLIMKVEKPSEQSTLQRILMLIEQDMGKKAENFSYEDTIAKLFIPLVIVLAIFAGYFQGTDSAIAILLISCPCAIGIAAPLAESHLIMELTSLGAIVRNRRALRFLGKDSIIVFDKTGTVTEGKFQVIKGLEELNSDQLAAIKTMAARSAHPLAYAISKAIENEERAYSKLEEVPGKGIRAIIDNKKVLLGSRRFLEEEGIISPEIETSWTTVYFADGDKAQCLLLGDKLRADAKNLKELLPEKKLILLSGDHPLAVERVAKDLQFDEWQAGMTPLEKKSYIEQLKASGSAVFMVGDGINDAPAIAASDVGISLVSASDISIQVSDILLIESLQILPSILTLGKRGQRVLKQNFFWAFFYNIIGVGLAALGLLTPIFSAFAMTTSSLMILFNSKRIKY